MGAVSCRGDRAGLVLETVAEMWRTSVQVEDCWVMEPSIEMRKRQANSSIDSHLTRCLSVTQIESSLEVCSIVSSSET